MKKKLLMLLTISTVALTLAACGGDSKKAEKATEKPEQTTASSSIEPEEVQKGRDFNQAETGEGIFNIASPAGSTADGIVPVVYYDEEVFPTAVSFETEGINGGNLTYIYVDGALLETQQLGDTMSEFHLQELPNAVMEGTHEIQLVQFTDDDDVSGTITMLKKQQYEIKVK